MSAPAVRLGLRENLAQFSLLVLVNAFVGAMIGMERSILPALAEEEFELAARSAILSFIVVFGVTKALTNYFAGRWSDRIRPQSVARAGSFGSVYCRATRASSTGSRRSLSTRSSCGIRLCLRTTTRARLRPCLHALRVRRDPCAGW